MIGCSLLRSQSGASLLVDTTLDHALKLMNSHSRITSVSKSPPFTMLQEYHVQLDNYCFSYIEQQMMRYQSFVFLSTKDCKSSSQIYFLRSYNMLHISLSVLSNHLYKEIMQTYYLGFQIQKWDKKSWNEFCYSTQWRCSNGARMDPGLSQETPQVMIGILLWKFSIEFKIRYLKVYK